MDSTNKTNKIFTKYKGGFPDERRSGSYSRRWPSILESYLIHSRVPGPYLRELY